MNRSAGWGAAALIAMLAFFGASRQGAVDRSPVVEQRRSGNVETNRQTTGKRAIQLSNEYGCQDLEDAIQRFFLVESTNVKAPSECFANTQSQSKPSEDAWKRAKGANYLIALLPDPIHTHMASIFDQGTEVIQHAAQAEGFAFDSSWLPWKSSDPPYLSLADSLEAQRIRGTQVAQPGVLLFRNSKNVDVYSGALVIFVVGEKATTGISKVQFENAAAWIKEFEGTRYDSDPLTILGPTASGSFASLQDVLTQLLSNTEYRKEKSTHC